MLCTTIDPMILCVADLVILCWATNQHPQLLIFFIGYNIQDRIVTDIGKLCHNIVPISIDVKI